MYITDCRFNQAVALKGSATDCAPEVTVGTSGQGFLIASDNLTKQPFGPGIQPRLLLAAAL